VAFEVFEYRNGVLISKIRREIEISVVICTNLPPVLQTDSLPGNLVFDIFETDSLCFTATYDDTDGDSLIITFLGDAFGGAGVLSPYATATTDSALITVNSNVCWKTICGHARSLPYVIIFNVTDDGCPLPTSASDTMFIYIHPMPLAGPFDMQCIGLVDQNTNRLTWVDSSGVGQYLQSYNIYRSTNGGPYTLLTTLNNDTVNQFDDVTAFDNTINNYCYYIKGINKCGVIGLPSDTMCSTGQDNLQKNYIEYVTVNKKNEIELKWETFPDGPYSTFYIYRSGRSSPGLYELRETLEKPVVESWLDKSVETDEESYCYYMVNRNLCGSLSLPSNIGCSILLRGEADPLVNNLNWTPYEDWRGGVSHYEIFRKSGDGGNFISTYNTPDSIRFFEDDMLDVNSGKYFYFIKGYEGAGGMGATSTSNEIELLQPPFIFIPSAFTPNGDGTNDSWGSFENFVKEIQVSVYNRWGQLLYSGKGNNASWNGTYDGSEVPEGLYIYEVKYSGFGKGQNYTLRGTVSVIR
nr:gliding motility-associated C-terminal domain-containing protein [Bacteroidia bacterium]